MSTTNSTMSTQSPTKPTQPTTNDEINSPFCSCPACIDYFTNKKKEEPETKEQKDRRERSHIDFVYNSALNSEYDWN